MRATGGEYGDHRCTVISEPPVVSTGPTRRAYEDSTGTTGGEYADTPVVGGQLWEWRISKLEYAITATCQKQVPETSL
jgi:hypothetical protein